MARFVVAVAVFIFQNKRFLTLRRSTSKKVAPGAWEVISGRVEPEEALYEAARRETYEETGMLIALDDRPMTAYQAAYGIHPMVVLVYRGQRLGGEVHLSSEHDAYSWVTGEEFSLLCPFEKLVNAARQAEKLPW